MWCSHPYIRGTSCDAPHRRAVHICIFVLNRILIHFGRILHYTPGHSFSLPRLFPICAKLRARGWNRKSATADRGSRVSRGCSRWPPAQPLLAWATPLSTRGPVIHCRLTASMLGLDKSIPPWWSAHCSPAAGKLPAARERGSLDGAGNEDDGTAARYELGRHWISTRIVFVLSCRTTVHREEIFFLFPLITEAFMLTQWRDFIKLELLLPH